MSDDQLVLFPSGKPGRGTTGEKTRPIATMPTDLTGTSSLTASWSAAALTSPPFGLLFCLAPAIEGWGGATLDERSQWWLMEEGRDVDLYF